MATSKAEYLKRYMSAAVEPEGGAKKKKRRKIKGLKPKLTEFKIIDEDIDLVKIQVDCAGVDEEEPTVAEVIDERPDAVKHMEEYTANNRWKKLADDSTKAVNLSPPRRQRHDSDDSPPRRETKDSDDSPPRRQRKDTDNSPPRRQSKESDNSPPRRQRKESDNSPPRRQRKDSDNSPPRRQRKDSDNSPPRRQRKDSENSPTRRRNKDSELAEGAKKTLSGKVAGLSSARDMRNEAQELKLKELQMFNKIGDDKLGKNSATVFRDKTGKRRDLESEKQQNDAKDAEWKNKYDKWAKGVAQGAAEEQRLAEMAHEMNKPLARGRDDADLDSHLREQDRDGDPMLAFIKNKTSAKSKGPKYPQYKGPAPEPNRFGIQPGYRWDGVDRGNGFEKKYFQSLSKKKAVSSEAYKWSTEDM